MGTFGHCKPSKTASEVKWPFPVDRVYSQRKLLKDSERVQFYQFCNFYVNPY